MKHRKNATGSVEGLGRLRWPCSTACRDSFQELAEDFFLAFLVLDHPTQYVPSPKPSVI